MPNSIFSTWVNNVNNRRLNSCITCVYISTARIVINLIKKISSAQLNVIHCIINYISTTQSTYILTLTNLLNKSFTYYPQYLLLKQLNKII
jgi:hypothetical protein